MQDNQKKLNGPYNEQVSPVVTPANPSGVGTGGTQAPVNGNDFLSVFVDALTKHLSAQDNLAPQRLQQGNDLLFGRNLGNNAAPSVNDARGSGNSWATSSWQSPADRYAEMRDHTGLAYSPTNPGLAGRQRSLAALGSRPDVEEGQGTYNPTDRTAANVFATSRGWKPLNVPTRSYNPPRLAFQ